MIVLDCESRASALETTAAAFGISSTALHDFLRGFNLAEHCEKSNPPHAAETELQRIVESEFGREPTALDRVCWFHLTRARSASDFVGGIHPLTDSIDLVWRTIIDVFRGSIHEVRLAEMRINGVDDDLYRLKVGKSSHAGPYAVLVKEFSARPADFYGHDYLRGPEIMEDICNGYYKTHGERIEERLIQALNPIIVKFWAPFNERSDLLETSLFYLYCGMHELSFGLGANTCFDGENRAVRTDQIIYAEQVQP